MSITLDPTVPADSESPRQGAARIRNLTLNLLSLFSQGGGSAVTFSNPPFAVDTSGNVTISTRLVVPTPTASNQAAQLGSVTGFAVGAPTTTTTLFNSTITSGSNASIFSLTSTPPGSTSLYRALVFGTVYFKANASSGSDSTELLVVLTDNASLFTTKTGSQGTTEGPAWATSSVSFSFLSNATRTNSAGSVSFALTGYAGSNGASINTNLLANSDLNSSYKSFMSISWIPAQ